MMRNRIPTMPRGVRRLFRLPLTRDRLARDAHEEMEFHITMWTAEFMARGMSETEACAAARERFGSSEEYGAYVERRAVRKARWSRVIGWLGEWAQDLRFATRQFRKMPVFSLTAVLTLALGIGANTAIYTVMRKVLIAPLPYADGDRIVLLAMEDKDHSLSDVDRVIARAWRARAHSFSAIASVGVDAILTQETEEQDTVTAFITPSYLDVLGVRPVLGRRLTEADVRPGAPAVAMITYGLWQRRFGGQRDVLGSRIESDGRAFTVVGVVPPEMGIPMSFSAPLARLAPKRLHEATPSIWAPVNPDSMAGRLFARLRPGVSPAQASRELQNIAATTSVAPTRPGMFRRPSCCARAWRAQDLLDPRETRTIEILFVAVGVLLLIACANVANLLMARAWTRRRDFAVRVAMGAGRARLVRLVLTEGLLLAAGGATAGVLLAWQALRAIVALRPPTLDHLVGVRLEPAVLLWSLAISAVTGLLFGAAPAVFAGDRSLGMTLRSEGHSGSRDTRSRRVRSALIVGEIALSLVLLTGAGLLMRSFVALQHTPLGFEPRGLVSIDILLPGPRALADNERAPLIRTLLDRLRSVPGVREAAIGMMPTVAYHAFGASLETEVDASGQSRRIVAYGLGFMSPNYFRVTGTTMLGGRLPDSTWLTPTIPQFPGRGDTSNTTAAAPQEILVNRTLAHRLFPNGRAVGARIHDGSANGRTPQQYTIIGVVDDARMPGASGPPEPMIYTRPLAISAPLVARVAGSPEAIGAAARRALQHVDHRVIPQTVIVGDDDLRDVLASTRFAMALLATFAGVAVLLAAIGLYGVIAYSVTQRTREIGVRVALGAAPRTVTTLVMGDGLRLATAGIAFGVVAAVLATRSLRGLLYGVTSSDPTTYLAIGILVAAVALVATYVPAQRALQIDPLEALRAE